MAYAANPSGFITSGASPSDRRVKKLAAGTNITLTNSGDTTTIAAAGGGGGGNTLDGAYDEGGAGVGRTITADTGAVEITSGANVPLKLNATGVNRLQITDGTDNVFLIDNTNAVGIGGPIQSVYEDPTLPKAPAPTAVDLQFDSTGNLAAKGVNSGLYSGKDNTIGAVALPSASVYADQAVILGGQQNTITSDSGLNKADNSAILGGDTNTISYDNTLAGNAPLAPVEDSAIIAGNGATISNSGASALVGTVNASIDSAEASGVYSGTSNSITASASIDSGRNNAILGGASNSITAAMTNPYGSGDPLNPNYESSNNVIIGGRTNQITGEARSCVVVGENGIATTNDHAVLYVAGIDAGGATLNAISLVGNAGAGGAVAGNGYADVAFNGGGADFAEMFEWDDGNPDDEDRVGYFVQLTTSPDGLSNGKIEIGGSGRIVGPVSSMPGSIVNAAGLNWNGRFVRDDFGRYQLDADGNRIEDPSYNPNLQYRIREARKEWSPIGLKGRVRVRASSNIGIYPSSKDGLTVDVASDGTVIDAGSKGKYKVIQVVKQKEIWSGPEGVFRRRRLVQDHGYGIVEILVE